MSASSKTFSVARADVEDFLFQEAFLLDNWKLKEWEELLTDDAGYYIPPNDNLEASHRGTLFTIADNRERIRQRVIRVLDPNCHAEHPHSHLSRIIGNVRLMDQHGDEVTVWSNFVCHRYRRNERIGEYVGSIRHILKIDGKSFKIKERRVHLKSHELGSLGSVSFIL